MYSYKQLENRLKLLNLNKSDLSNNIGISSRTIAKMAKGEKIANHVLEKIANYLNCNTTDLYSLILDKKILQILRD